MSAVIDPAEVLAGDVVTARFVETGEEITATAYHPETAPTGWVSLLGWPLSKGNGKFGLGITKFELISATRPAPEHAPGTTGTATVRVGDETIAENEPGVWVEFDFPDHGRYLSFVLIHGGAIAKAEHVTDFVPDPDTTALRDLLEIAEAQRNEANARADAAEARLARLTEENVIEALSPDFRGGELTRYGAAKAVLALVAADEQAAEGGEDRG